MPKDIDRKGVRRLVREGAYLVEVLPRKEYEEWHLPGAMHISLRKVNAETTAHLHPDVPVIVYCHDGQ